MSSNPPDPFSEARNRFLSSLPPNELAKFRTSASASDVTADVKNLHQLQKLESGYSSPFEKIDRFTQSLRPYFDVVGIFIQSHPEVSAIAWGAIRLVLQLASNFVEFFKKLANAFDRLNAELPRFEEVKNVAEKINIMAQAPEFKSAAPERLRRCLTEFYVDLLSFLQSVARIFTKKDLSAKPTPLIFPSLFWKPFDSRFEDLLNHMKMYKEFIKEELQLLQLQLAIIEYDAAKEERNLKANEWAQQADERRKQAEERTKQAEERMKQADERMEQAEEKLKQAEERKKQAEERILQAEERVKQAGERILQIEERRLAASGRDAIQRIEELMKSMKSNYDRNEERKYRDGICRRAQAWLLAPEYATAFEEAHYHQDKGTGQWLFDTPEFKSLFDTSQGACGSRGTKMFGNHILWVTGNPGCGKTVLAASAVHYARHDIPCETYYFFFRSEDRVLETPIAAYRSMLAQILHFNRGTNDILDAFAFAMSNSESGQTVATLNELRQLLVICAQSLDPHAIVLDGIDECSDPDMLSEDIALLTNTESARLVLFSRPNVLSLSRNVPPTRQFSIGKETSPDISLYLERRLNVMAHEGDLPFDMDLNDAKDRLVTGADGMFLWARLIIDYLKSLVLNPEERRQTIMEVCMPEGLDKMYDRIVKSIAQRKRLEVVFARYIISWLAYSKRQLTTRELEEALKVYNKAFKYDCSGTANLDQTLTMVCASLVEKGTFEDPRYPGQTACYRFIHLSAKEYFRSLDDDTFPWYDDAAEKFNPLRISRVESNIIIIQVSLRYLDVWLPKHKLENSVGINFSTHDLDEIYPLSNYTSLFWTSHLAILTTQPLSDVFETWKFPTSALRSLIDALSHFIGKRESVMVYIEACYAFGTLPDSESLEKWSGWVRQGERTHPSLSTMVGSVPQDISELASYFSELHGYWGSQLKSNPGMIWEEVTAFTPSKFLLHDDATKVESLYVDNPSSPDLSTSYLCRISEANSELFLASVLTVWPPRNYQQEILKDKVSSSIDQLAGCCVGWIARYEIWSINGPPQRKYDIHIPLNETEVRIQLQQSLRKTKSWATQFPCSICPSTLTFTVLRTVYRLTHEHGTRQIHSCVFPTNFHSDPKRWWSDPQVNADLRQEESRYVYWLRCSPDGSFVFFLDKGNVSLCKVTFNGTMRLDLINAMSGKLFESMDSLRWIDVAFHPQQSLLAFTAARSVFIWAFDSSTGNPKKVYETPGRSLTFPEKINFSACSSYLLVKERDVDLPAVIRIPNELIPTLPATSSQNASSPSLSVSGPMRPTGSQLTGNFGSPSSGLRGNAMTMTGNGTGTGITTVQTRNGIDVMLWQGNGTDVRYERVQLTATPYWAGMGATSTSVHLPQAQGDAVNLIINKSVQPENSLSTHAKEHLPAIVERDTRALKTLSTGSTKRALVCDADQSTQPTVQRPRLME